MTSITTNHLKSAKRPNQSTNCFRCGLICISQPVYEVFEKRHFIFVPMPRFSLPLTGEFPLSVYACIVSYTGTGTSISTSSYVLSAVSLWHLMSTIFSPFSFSGLFLLVFGVF